MRVIAASHVAASKQQQRHLQEKDEAG